MKQLIETHGKTENKEQFQLTLLEQVWGADNFSKYGTLDEGVYQDRLHHMTRSDLETHARQVGVIVVDYTPRLVDKLLSEFRSYVALAKRPMLQGKTSDKTKTAVEKLLSDAR